MGDCGKDDRFGQGATIHLIRGGDLPRCRPYTGTHFPHAAVLPISSRQDHLHEKWRNFLLAWFSQSVSHTGSPQNDHIRKNYRGPSVRLLRSKASPCQFGRVIIGTCGSPSRNPKDKNKEPHWAPHFAGTATAAPSWVLLLFGICTFTFTTKQLVTLSTMY